MQEAVAGVHTEVLHYISSSAFAVNLYFVLKML